MRREWIEMKHRLRASELLASPSMRREWIEIRFFAVKSIIQTGLPPCGGSGLKLPGYKRRLENGSLPPCGGSGLKCSWERPHAQWRESPSMRREWIEISPTYPGVVIAPSPSMRREWIEIPHMRSYSDALYVSLHTEGVD